jgi:integrase
MIGVQWHDGDFVFTTPRGRPLNASNVTHAFQDALRRAGLPRQRFHDLRHAFATLQLEDGEELAVISRMLGPTSRRRPTSTRTLRPLRSSDRPTEWMASSDDV